MNCLAGNEDHAKDHGHAQDYTILYHWNFIWKRSSIEQIASQTESAEMILSGVYLPIFKIDGRNHLI